MQPFYHRNVLSMAQRKVHSVHLWGLLVLGFSLHQQHVMLLNQEVLVMTLDILTVSRQHARGQRTEGSRAVAVVFIHGSVFFSEAMPIK